MRLTESYVPADTSEPVLELTVGDVLRQAAARWPRATALVEADIAGQTGRRWTFAELLADAERLAHALVTRYQPGERIAVWAPNVPEWVIVEYGAALAGLTLVTVNPAYRPRELRFVLEQSRAVGLFLTREHRGTPMAEIAAEVAPQLAAIREVVDVEDRSALFARGAARRDLPSVAPGDSAQIQYTSGTTGFPKGAVLHHRGLTNNARFVFARGRAEEGRAVLNFMPMFHTSGCSALTLGAIQFGCAMIIARLFAPGPMLDLIDAEAVHLILGVPTMLWALLEEQARSPRKLSSLAMTISGGSMVPPELVRRWRAAFGCDFETVYGQTEASPVVTQTRADDSFGDLCDTVGQVLPRTEVSIRDPRSGRVVPIGTIGEICARGYCVMTSYNDNPAATDEAIDAEGWLHTGDLGALDARGYLRVTGRVKEMIIRGGENLFPAEIENVLLEHPDIAEVAVVGVPDERWGEVIACFVRLAAGARLDAAGLRAHCRAQLSPQKTPAHWIAVDAWPLTGSGKIQKFVLRDRFAAGEWA